MLYVLAVPLGGAECVYCLTSAAIRYVFPSFPNPNTGCPSKTDLTLFVHNQLYYFANRDERFVPETSREHCARRDCAVYVFSGVPKSRHRPFADPFVTVYETHYW